MPRELVCTICIIYVQSTFVLHQLCYQICYFSTEKNPVQNLRTTVLTAANLHKTPKQTKGEDCAQVKQGMIFVAEVTNLLQCFILVRHILLYM